MTMMQEEVRHLDLLPDVPISDDGNAPEIYADSVSELMLHGANFTTTYFVWRRNGPAGLLQRSPVARIIRPYESVFGMRETIANMLKGKLVLPN